MNKILQWFPWRRRQSSKLYDIKRLHYLENAVSDLKALAHHQNSSEQPLTLYRALKDLHERIEGI